MAFPVFKPCPKEPPSPQTLSPLTQISFVGHEDAAI